MLDHSIPPPVSRVRRLVLKGLAGACLAAPTALQPAAPVNTVQLLNAIVRLESRVPPTARTARSLGTERVGSGVVIDAGGLIVTIGYLILEATHVTVVSAEGERVPCQVLAYDHNTGFGLVRALEPLPVAPIHLGNSADVETGQQVLVASYGGTGAARPAIVVSRRPFAGFWEYLLENAVFVAPAHPLFSGAALLDPEGKLLGIGSLVVRDAFGDPQPLPGNLFVPIDELKPIMGDLLTTGRSSGPRRPWLGVYTEQTGRYLSISRVAAGGPAAAAGLEKGDLIVAVDDQPVASMEEFYRRLWASRTAGDPIKLDVLRDTEIRSIDVRSGDRYDWLRLHQGS